MNGASHSTLDNEFGTHDEEAVIKQILEKGTLQESTVRALLLPARSSPYLFLTRMLNANATQH
jgi:hypothetical protein